MIMPAPKTLSAYKDLDSSETSMGLGMKIKPVLVYLIGFGYELNAKDEGDIIINEYEGPNSKVILKQIPEPSAEELKRLRHDWEFNCPFDEADMHIENLERIYKRIGFEIDE